MQMLFLIYVSSDFLESLLVSFLDKGVEGFLELSPSLCSQLQHTGSTIMLLR